MAMDVLAPRYYLEFKCTADKCRHSCCCGWRIEIDADTERTYREMKTPLGVEICSRLASDSDGVYIPLGEDGRCPFLDELGLCRIISEAGEGCISEICREHPRFYNHISGRLELGIGAACEEAARIILCSALPHELVKVGEYEGECETCGIDTASAREGLFTIMTDNNLSYHRKIERIERDYSVSAKLKSDEQWREIFASLDYLSQTSRALLSGWEYKRAVGEDKCLERYLAYLLYRHTGAAESQEELTARIGFCLLSARVFESLIARAASDNLAAKIEAARIYSEEIEYSEGNTDALIFEFECELV